MEDLQSPRAATGDVASFYRTHGYVIFRGLIPPAEIDSLLERYRREIVPSSKKFFRQNTNRYETNVRNAHGHVRQSFLDVHAYASEPKFQEALMRIFASEEMLGALSRITGSPKHNLMQSMLFDLNAETQAHQDWWYLDSVPPGGLLASWIALEDILEEAGRFYVLPGTQSVALHETGMAHEIWLQRIAEYVDAHHAQIYAPELRKGDVLFWNSRTIHGSLKTLDERNSRKSLTAHYLPSDLTFGNLFVSKPWIQYSDWNGVRYFANQPEYSLRADLTTRAKRAIYNNPALLRIARRLQKRSLADLT